MIAGLDPWDVVDEAWGAMAENGFSSKGPFVPHAVVVARNKAVDVMRRVEAWRGDRSIDAEAERTSKAGTGEPARDPRRFERGRRRLLRGLDELAAIQRLALAEEAIYTAEVLTRVEREVFIAVRVDGKSRAAVGRSWFPADRLQRGPDRRPGRHQGPVVRNGADDDDGDEDEDEDEEAAKAKTRERSG